MCLVGSKASSRVLLVALPGQMFTMWHQSDFYRGASKVTYWFREEDDKVGQFDLTRLKSENSHEH